MICRSANRRASSRCCRTARVTIPAVVLLLASAIPAVEYPKTTSTLNPVSSGRATVGTPFTMTLTVIAPDLTAVTIDEPFRKDADTTWTLIARTAEPDRKINATEFERRITYRIATFTTGQVHAPEFVIHYRAANGPERTRIATADPVEISSVLPQTASKLDPKDGKPPLALPFPRWILVAAGLVGLLLVGLVARLVWARMRHRIIQVVNAPKSLDEWALEQMDVLERERLVEQKKFKEYYTRLTDIARSYIGRMFDIQALDLTSYELLTRLDDTRMTRKAHETLAGLLEEADLVKFARHTPEAVACRHALDTAREIVSLTRHHLAPSETEPVASQAATTVETSR